MQAAALAAPAAVQRVAAAGRRHRSTGRPLPQFRAVPHPALVQRRPACTVLSRCTRPVLAAAAGAAAVPEPGGSSAAVPAAGVQHKRGWAAQLTPLSDPAANSKLLALSAAQMLSSIATLMHDTYLPIYMSDVLHMSNTGMGNLHALLQFLSKASGVVSGRMADLLSPARMVILGTGLTALLCKPMFAVCGLVRSMAGTQVCVQWVTTAKILDRTVKGVREAPSKALVGELAAQSGDSAAAAFSVRQALSTLGMLLGTTAAGLAFALSGRSYEVTFALSAVASLMALALVATAFGRDAAAGAAERAELTRTMDEQDAGMTLGDKARALKDAFPPAYWQALAVVMALYLARFDVAFITLHASAVMDKARIPTLTFFSMAPVVALATPMGLRAKQSVAARNRVLMLGMSALIAANICFALVPSYLGMAAGNAFIGLHMAMTQGIAFGMLASYIPSGVVPGLGRVNGTAWSLTDLLLGVALAGSNTLAGRLADWSKVRGLGVRGCFGGAAASCLLSMAVLAAFSTFGDLGREDLVGGHRL